MHQWHFGKEIQENDPYVKPKPALCKTQLYLPRNSNLQPIFNRLFANNGMALTLKLICFTSSKKHKRPHRNGVDMEKGKVIFENYCSICICSIHRHARRGRHLLEFRKNF